MRVSIGSDHAGFEQKQALVDYLVGKGYDVIDRGPDSDDRVDYPDYASPVAHDVADGTADRGVLVCGTGIGMALCREHNDANVITLSGRFVPLEENERILDTFFATDFGGGRHAGRGQKIMQVD